MKLSFTGTRQGMTPEQKEAFGNVLNNLTGSMLIHGDCIGADADAHNIAKENGLTINIRPCTLTDQRANCIGGEIIAEAEKPLDRNRKIVDDGDLLIGCPAAMFETQRGGTWYTLNYAKKNKRPYIVIWPNGDVELETDHV